MNAVQERMFKAAIGDETYWPFITDDPVVNAAVDHHVLSWDGVPDWDGLKEDEKQILRDEVVAWEEQLGKIPIKREDFV